MTENRSSSVCSCWHRAYISGSIWILDHLTLRTGIMNGFYMDKHKIISSLISATMKMHPPLLTIIAVLLPRLNFCIGREVLLTCFIALDPYENWIQMQHNFLPMVYSVFVFMFVDYLSTCIFLHQLLKVIAFVRSKCLGHILIMLESTKLWGSVK